MPLSAQLVHDRLSEAARRFRWSRSARFAVSGTAIALAFLFVFLLSDAQFHFGAPLRWAGFLLVTVPLLAGLAMAVRAALPTVTESRMARRIEIACGGAKNVLINAVQFDRELPAGSSLRAALFAEMDDPFPRVDWSQVFDLKLLKRLGYGLVGVLLVLALCAALKPLMFANSAARILMPGSNIAPLTRTQFSAITPGDTRIIHGKDLTVTVNLTGEIPRAAWIWFREAGGGSWQKALMDREVGAPVFSHQWREMRESLEYTLEAGDATSATFHATVRPKTAIRTRSAEVELPAYALRAVAKGAGIVALKDFSVLQNVIPGSRVSVTMEFNNPVRQLAATPEKGQPFQVRQLADTRWNFSGTVTAGQTVRIDYRDTDDLADADSLQIVTKADEPPKVAVTEPAEGRELFAARDASVTIRFTATDNFALGTVALYRSTDEAQDAQVIHDWKEAAGKASFAGEFKVPLKPFAKEDRVTFCIAAKDQNDVSGPGVTYSRPIVVTLRSADQLQQKSDDAANKAQNSLEALIKLQKINLEATANAAQNPAPASATLSPLLGRQTQVGEMAQALVASVEPIAPGTRADLQALSEKEMPAAVLALRNAVAAADRKGAGNVCAASLAEAIRLESAILVRLQGVSKALAGEMDRGQVRDLIAGVEDLLRKQRDLLRETANAPAQSAAALSDRQDALAQDATRVRKTLDKNALNTAMGDQDFRTRLATASKLFGEMRIYEEMLAAAEKLQGKAFQAAAGIQKELVTNLAKIADLLNQWQFAKAAKDADSLKEAAKEMADKLNKLAAIQREIVEKSKELARKSEMRPEDASTAKEFKDTKDLMKETIEQMLTDAHIFPDLKPSNELRSQLTEIFEDVIQTDKALAAAGQLKPNEIAVQKEDGILQAIEQAKKISEDMEMWLPNANDTAKWKLENFDKTEMPDIPNLPLPEAFTDLVGDLLQEQQGLAEQVQDAASNQAAAQNPANGWGVADGPQPGFGAQGRSGNTRPKKNEQTGRSSGGREGMSDGEMVGDTASNLEGTKPDVRRTNDPMQQGQVKDEGKIGETRATGGGKAGGFSDRNGMDGNAPLRPTNAPKIAASDALAVQQALLSEKTAKMHAQASLLYLKATALPDVVRLMDEAHAALKEGRTQDYRGLHQRIVGRLNEVRGGALTGDVLTLSNGDAARAHDKQLLGGDEGQAPPAFKDAVADYYRSLLEEGK